MSNYHKKIHFIEVLRAVAPILVVAYHASSPLVLAYESFPGLGLDLFRNGNIGVDIFFLISGFIISYTTQRREDKPLVSFIIRRFFRIYPLFITCLLIAWMTYYSWKSSYDFFYSSLLLQGDYSATAPFFGYNMLYPAWTISFEVLFYSLFLIGMAINHKHRVLISTFIIIISLALIQIVFTGELSASGSFSVYSNSMGYFTAPLTTLGSPLFLEFVIGMLLFKIYDNMNQYDNKYLALTMSFISAFGLYLFITVDTKIHGLTDKGQIALLIFSSLMFAEKFGLNMSFRLTRFFSDISYSLYLTHAIVLKLYMSYLNSIGVKEFPKGIISFIAIFIVCIIVAYISHITIEKYFINRGKAIISVMCRKQQLTLAN